jgi:hypothetical protein
MHDDGFCAKIEVGSMLPPPIMLSRVVGTARDLASYGVRGMAGSTRLQLHKRLGLRVGAFVYAIIPVMSDQSNEYLAVKSAGSIADISPRTLRYWIKGGKLPTVAGPKGKLVRLSDVLAMAELTGKSTAGERQTAGRSAVSATSAESFTGNTTGNDQVVVAPTAMAQLEAIRDQWLRPLIDELNEKSEEIGRLKAERDAAVEHVGIAEAQARAAQQERDALRWERDQLAEQLPIERATWEEVIRTSAERDLLREENDRLKAHELELRTDPLVSPLEPQGEEKAANTT